MFELMQVLTKYTKLLSATNGANRHSATIPAMKPIIAQHTPKEIDLRFETLPQPIPVKHQEELMHRILAA